MLYGFEEDIMFKLVPVIITMAFVVVLGGIVTVIVQSIKQNKKDNASPILTVYATIVDKRENVTRSTHTHGTDMACTHTSANTRYYVTFEVESGSRMEFHVPDDEYGYLIRGDYGKLTFQGSRYMSFKRI